MRHACKRNSTIIYAVFDVSDRHKNPLNRIAISLIWWILRCHFIVCSTANGFENADGSHRRCIWITVDRCRCGHLASPTNRLVVAGFLTQIGRSSVASAEHVHSPIPRNEGKCAQPRNQCRSVFFFVSLKFIICFVFFFFDVSCRTKQKKIEKRNRKLIDYDGQRHSFQNLQASSAKRKDDVKVTKGREQLEEAKRTYEILNTELHDELPALNDSRILFLVTNLQTLFASEQIFHNETQKVCVSGRCLFVATFCFFSRSAGWVRWRVCVCVCTE